MKKTVVNSKNAPEPLGPYSHSIKAGGFLFASGQTPIDMQAILVEGGIEEQTKQVFKNLEAVLTEAGLTFDNVVKTTVFMTDLGEFAQMNAVYGTFFKENPPARSTVQVAALPKNSKVEIELIAVI